MRKKKMIRPFKTVEELTQETGLCLEKSIVMRTKKADENIELITGLVTGFYTQKKKVAIGASLFSLQELFDNYEYEDKDEWRPFGVEEPEEPKEQAKTRKFKVGKRYCFLPSIGRGYPVLINAKYRDPEDNKIKVVINGTTFSTVYTNKDGDERATFFNEEIKAENEIKNA